MKKLILVLAIVFLFASVAMAATIICNPVDPATCGGVDQPNCPVSATLYRYADSTYTNGFVVVADHPLEADMSLRYDVTNEPAGVNFYKALYKDQNGGPSLLSNPTVLGSSEPQNLRLIP